VGVDGYDDAAAAHDRHVVRDRVLCFDLVAPVLRECGCHGAVLRDLVRDLVALEHVLERVDAEAEVLRYTHEHQDLVAAIAVRVDLDVAAYDVRERLETEIATRRYRVPVTAFAVRLPLGIVLLRLCEPPAECLLDTHARLRKPPERVGRRRTG